MNKKLEEVASQYNLHKYGTKHPIFYGCPWCGDERQNLTILCDNDCNTIFCGNNKCGKEYYQNKSKHLQLSKGHDPDCGKFYDESLSLIASI